MLARLRHLPPTTKQRLRSATKQIDTLWRTHVKPMDYERELYTLRVHDWRVILNPLPEPGAYEVENFGPRPEVYANYPRMSQRD